MPWSARDASKHKKGLTSKQKQDWAATANSVYRKCISDGKSVRFCEGKAIRVANSRFSGEGGQMAMTKVPRNALIFMEPSTEDCIQFRAGEDDKADQMQIKVYSGRVIPNHWYWDNLVVDLDGMRFAGRFPILEEHERDKKIGFSTKRPVVTDDYTLLIGPENVQFVDTEESQKFRRLSRQGFPYQASMYAKPTEIQRLARNETADVNGFKFKGPGTIWRKSLFKEASIAVFGFDPNTRARAFAEDDFVELAGIEPINELSDDAKSTEDHMPDENITVEQFKEQSPDAYKELVDSVTSTVTADLEAKHKQSLSNVESKFASDLADSNKKIQALERANTLREEQDLQRGANGIWATKLSASKIPNRMHEKIAAMVDYNDFVNADTNVFDKAKFSEAVDAEIKYWQDNGVVKSTVRGAGSFASDEVGTDAEKMAEEEKEDNSWLDDMTARAGRQAAA